MDVNVWQPLSSHVKLERDKALYTLKRYIAQSKSFDSQSKSPSSSDQQNGNTQVNVTHAEKSPVDSELSSNSSAFVATKAPFSHPQPSPSVARERNLPSTDSTVFSLTSEHLSEVAHRLLRELGNCELQDESWEYREGLFRAVAILIDELPQFGAAQAKSSPSKRNFTEVLTKMALHALNHSLEVRIRKAAGNALSSLCSRKSLLVDSLSMSSEQTCQFLESIPSASESLSFPRTAAGNGTSSDTGSLFQLIAPILLQSIEIDRQSESTTLDDTAATADEATSADSSIEPGDAASSSSSTSTRGWRTIETSIRAVTDSLKCSPADLQLSRAGLARDLALCFLRNFTHGNRYVREACFFLLEALLHRRPRFIGETPSSAAAAVPEDLLRRMKLVPPDSLKKESAFSVPLLVEGDGSLQDDADSISMLEYALAQGLTDNWSQVRFAATQAALSLFFPNTESETPHDSAAESQLGDVLSSKRAALLLPPLCINRYYVAEGVRVVTLRLWKRLFSGEGARSLIARLPAPFVRFYTAQSDADNHAVREAAARCIAELARKIDSSAIEPFVQELMDALLSLFRDESWPVRDCACVASAKFFAIFPRHCVSAMPELEELWMTHLQDNIWSVRENSAIALGDVLDALVDLSANEAGLSARAFANRCVTRLNETLEAAQAQKASQKSKSVHDNDVHAHTGQQIYSCGSLAPKLKKRGVGCMDHGFSRPTEPWEQSDGAVYLLRELLNRRAFVLEGEESAGQALLSAWLGKLASLLRVRGFLAYSQLIETVCKNLISICKAAGVKFFFKHVFAQHFAPPLFELTNDDSRLAAKTAEFTLLDLREVDSELFNAALTSDQKKIMFDFDDAI